MTSLSEAARPWTRDSLASHIEGQILAESLATGLPLPSERHLAASLGVSRSLVREVLRGLEQRGLLDVRPGKGAYARSNSPSEAARELRNAYQAAQATPTHLMEARSALERQAAGLAAVRIQADELRRLETTVIDLQNSESITARIAADIAFHSLLVRAAGNPLLATIFESLESAFFDVLLESSAQGQDTALGVGLHTDVLRAIASGEPASSVTAMESLMEYEAHGFAGSNQLSLLRQRLHWTGSGISSSQELLTQTVRGYLSDSKE